MDKKKAQKASIILEKVLKDITPSKEETQQTIYNVNNLMARLRNIVHKDVELIVAGSIARGTNLKGNADIDIFMLFKNTINKEKMVQLGLHYGRSLADKRKGEVFEIKYAEHPYVRINLKSLGLRVDVVPAFKIDNIEKLATSVDRTPLHNNFINTHLSNKQRDDVRLLKYLLKNHNIYGAEVKTGGFSGYLCELMVYYFGSFLNVLEKCSNLTLPTVIHPKSNTEIKDENAVKKFNSGFIVIDPVDPNRNVAAGVSIESLSRLVLVAREFILNPDIKSLYGCGFSSPQTRALLSRFVKATGFETFLLVLNVPDKSTDVIWPQLRKVSSFIESHIKRFGFDPYFIIPWTDGAKGLILVMAPKKQLLVRMYKGPDVFSTNASNNFIKTRNRSLGFVIDNSTIYALDKNKYSEIKWILADVVAGKVIKRHKEINFRGAKLFVNNIPARYSKTAYAELHKRLHI